MITEDGGGLYLTDPEIARIMAARDALAGNLNGPFWEDDESRALYMHYIFDELVHNDYKLLRTAYARWSTAQAANDMAHEFHLLRVDYDASIRVVRELVSAFNDVIQSETLTEREAARLAAHMNAAALLSSERATGVPERPEEPR